MINDFDENYETDSHSETWQNVSQEMDELFPDLELCLNDQTNHSLINSGIVKIKPYWDEEKFVRKRQSSQIGSPDQNLDKS